MITLKKLPLSKREIILVIIFFTALLYVLGWHFSGKYLLDNIKITRSSIGSLKNEQALLLSLIEESTVLEYTFREEKDRHEQLADILPDLESLPRVLSEMESFITGNPVKINSLRIGDTMYYDQHAAVAMQVKATAAPNHLLSFLKELETLPNVVCFDYLTWNRRAGSEIEMELKLQLLFYNPDLTSKPGGEL